MADTFENRLKAARGKRQFVARAANEFLTLANHDLSTVANISWDALLTSPAWCVLEKQQLSKLIEICGALCIAPVLKTQLMENCLKNFSYVWGNDYFQKIFHNIDEVQAITDTREIYLPQLSMHRNIQRAGRSVLVGTIVDANIRNLYANEFGSDLFAVGEVESSTLYQSATKLLNEDVNPAKASVRH